MKKHWLKHLGLCMLLLAGLSAHTVLMAQSDPDGKSPATFTYVIKNATVVQAPGKVLNGATVIVKDGLISAVGSNVQIPVGAYEIDGEGMFVYPGFIDGLSQAAVKRPENPERPRDLQPSMPPNNIAGITPELSVKDYLEPGAKALDDMRKAGFTAGHVVPNGRMLPGSSSFILFGTHSEADQLILKNGVGMFAQLQGAQGVYPSTVIAVMSKWRELYKNAQLAQENDRIFASNSAGINRPVRDRVLEAFYPVINKQQPVFFHAPNQLDVRRVLNLQKDTGFNLVLVNVKQGWGMENEIKAAGGKVLLSLDLPEDKKAAEDASNEVKAREERRTDAYKQHVSLAADYEKAGIKFGFAGVAVSPSNIKKNLKTMIDNGLSENAALAALTTTPAEMFGLTGMMGTVDAGKIANLFISTGNYFDKDSEVKYVFVDGKLSEYESRPARSANNGAAGNGAAAANIAGKWSYTMESPMGASDGEMTFERAGDEYKGAMTFGMGGTNSTLDMRDIRVEGSNLRFSVMIEMGGQSITLRVNGTVEGDNFSGSIDTGNFGSFAVKGKRIGQ